MTAFELATELYNMAVDGVDGTISAEDKPLPRSGYLVGGAFPSLVFENKTQVDRGELAWWIGSNEPMPYYGVWVDTDTGKVYFDGVEHLESPALAGELGRQRGEIAIWDIEAGEELRLEGA